MLVSTIHERLWDLIKRYQDELVNIHLERIEADISNIIESPLETVWLNGLSDEEMDNFKSFLYENIEMRWLIGKLIRKLSPLAWLRNYCGCW